MPATLQDYLSLIAPEHQNKPDYMATVSFLIAPIVDTINLFQQMLDGTFDLDIAVGQQLDFVGRRVGASRQLKIAIDNIFFSTDVDGQGFDQGIWQEDSSVDQLYSLPDDAYLILIKATIAANYWDGTPANAYDVWQVAFGYLGYTLIMEDNQDMSFWVIVIGPPLSAIMYALLTGGYLDLKPGAVRLNGYLMPSVPDYPIFAMDVDNDNFKGFDEGAWLVPIAI